MFHLNAKVFFVLGLLSLLAFHVNAEPVCSFDNTGHRRIDHTNPKDWQCMKRLAAQGDAYWQFYVGLQLVEGFSPEGGDDKAYNVERKGNPEGIKLLESAAKSKASNVSANAMNMLAKIYMSEEGYKVGLQDYELAYQWTFLASKQKMFKDARLLPDARFDAHISPKRKKELQKHASELLDNHSL